jgi:hypothetical protein
MKDMRLHAGVNGMRAGGVRGVRDRDEAAEWRAKREQAILAPS